MIFIVVTSDSAAATNKTLAIIRISHSGWDHYYFSQEKITYRQDLDHVPLHCVHNTTQWKFHKSCTHTVQLPRARDVSSVCAISVAVVPGPVEVAGGEVYS